MTMAISKAAEAGARAVICASTGQHQRVGRGVRGAGRHDLRRPRARRARSRSASSPRRSSTAPSCCRSTATSTTASTLARELSEHYPVALVNSVNPVRIEGQKTAAFEIVDALGDAPGRPLPAGGQRRQHHRLLEGLPRVRRRRHGVRAPADVGLPGGRRRADRRPARRSRNRRRSPPRSASATRRPGAGASRPATSPAALIDAVTDRRDPARRTGCSRAGRASSSSRLGRVRRRAAAGARGRDCSTRARRVVCTVTGPRAQGPGVGHRRRARRRATVPVDADAAAGARLWPEADRDGRQADVPRRSGTRPRPRHEREPRARLRRRSRWRCRCTTTSSCRSPTTRGSTSTCTARARTPSLATRKHLVVEGDARRVRAHSAVSRAAWTLVCANRIPHGRGLGSSAAAIVSGIVRGPCARRRRRRAAARRRAARAGGAELEGHPDNVAACTARRASRSPGARPARSATARPGPARRRHQAMSRRAWCPSCSCRTTPGVDPQGAPDAARAGAVRRRRRQRRPGRAARRGAGAGPRPGAADGGDRGPAAPAVPGARDAHVGGPRRQAASAGIPAVISGAGPTVLALADEATAAGVERLAGARFVTHLLAVDDAGAAVLPLDA